MVPEDYLDYYRRRRVSAVVRLNKKVHGWAEDEERESMQGT